MNQDYRTTEYQGYVSLFLHGHLPFVRHPEHEDFLEERWLYEAITETYLPLLKVFENLARDKVPFRIALSLTPPLVTMLQDPLLQERYVRHISKLIELCENELTRTASSPHFHALAVMYQELFLESRTRFVEQYGCDLVMAFKRLQDAGHIEIAASCATHGFLPLLRTTPATVEAQIRVGVDHYRATFQKDPVGFWLPECGFYPGVDEILNKEGIRYFLLDSHGIMNAEPSPRYQVYAPLYCPSGVAAFGRDWESSKQVWSSKEGYPGDFDYREYYRDLGHELDMEYIHPYIHPMGIRINTGLKYWRITGETEDKQPYIPEDALKKASVHAGNFMFNREKQIEFLAGNMDRKPIVVAPYDMELFGHWWFEGPLWLDFLIRKIASEQKTIALRTPGDYLQEYPVNQMAIPSLSSWGHKGYAEYWLDESNDWIYRHLDVAAMRMAELGARYRKKDIRRAIDQAARELLLAQSSDWPFIMKAGTMVPYAEKRFRQHIGRFTKLYESIHAGTVDENFLTAVEQQDTIFGGMECGAYFSPRQSTETPPRSGKSRKKARVAGASGK